MVPEEPLPQPIADGEGLGNRFLLYHQLEDFQLAWLQEAAPNICREQYDGLLVIEPRQQPGELAVQVINRDGSDGGVCLNGLRVVALWSGEADGVLHMAGKQLPWRRMAMPAIFDPNVDPRVLDDHIDLHLLPHTLPDSLWQPHPLQVAGHSAWAVGFWNPHCVVEVDDPSTVDLSSIAAQARQRADLFPNGANVEVVNFNQAQMRVDERGVGETQACGSGAVAVAVAIWSCHRAAVTQAADGGSRQPLLVQMPGGNLTLERPTSGGIRLAGAATVSCFEGK